MSMQNWQPTLVATRVAARSLSRSSTRCACSCHHSNAPQPIMVGRLCAITGVIVISRPYFSFE